MVANDPKNVTAHKTPQPILTRSMQTIEIRSLVLFGVESYADAIRRHPLAVPGRAVYICDFAFLAWSKDLNAPASAIIGI